VFIQDGKVAAASGATVPPDTEVVNCAGLTITAGFCNSHVHFFERKWANAAAIPAAELMRQLQDFLTRYGFTTVFDLSSPWQNTRVLRDRIESGEVPGPRIRSTGQGLLAPGVLPPEAVNNLMGLMKYPIATTADAGAAGAAAKKLVHEGVNGIKLFLKSFPVAGIAAAVAEARRAAMPVFVHPTDGADVLAALRAGVDVIAHTTPQSGPWDDKLLAAIKRAALTPTLTLWKHYMRHDRLSTQEQMTQTAVGQLRAWIGAGGSVLFGTDLGAVEPDPAAVRAASGAGAAEPAAGRGRLARGPSRAGSVVRRVRPRAPARSAAPRRLSAAARRFHARAARGDCADGGLPAYLFRRPPC